MQFSFYQVIIQNGWDQTARYRISSIQDNRLDVKFEHHNHQSPSERVLRTSRYPYHSTRYQKLIHSSGNRFFMFGIVDWMMPTIKKVTTVVGYAGMTPIHLPRCSKHS